MARKRNGKGKISANRTALQKRGATKSASQDEISKLPDDVLVAILYFLTFKEATVTSVLSRRWINLWKSHTVLHFDAVKALESVVHDRCLLDTERAKYVKWVNQVLGMHQGTMIKEFRIFFDLGKVNKLDIDNWLTFAFAKKVQRLELDLKNWCKWSVEELYTFPIELFLAQCMGNLLAQPHASCGGPLSSTFLGIKSLKTLSLKYVNVTDETFEFILLNCQCLENLLVHHSPVLVKVEISGQSLMLRSLDISYCNDLKSIKIRNTNLVSFKCLGPDEGISLQDLPFLAEVCIGWFTPPFDVFSAFSSCAFNLEVLTLHFMRKKSTDELPEFPALPRLKQLTLACAIQFEDSLLEFASNINAFPCLQKCSIQLLWLMPTRLTKSMEKIPDLPHHCLKVVEFGGYYGRTCDFDLAMYFVKNAVVLEELTIDPHNQCDNELRILGDIRETEEEINARNLAKKQLMGKVPQRIKLTIL